MRTIKESNQLADKHFFDRSTMRFFRSKVATRRPLGGQYFVTSEQENPSAPRLYTVRQILESGDIITVGEFQQYKSLEAAKNAIKLLPCD
jgi:hypothetical protein